MNGRAVFSATLGRPFFFGDLDMIGVGAGTALGADDGFACLDVGPDTRLFRGVRALGSVTRIRSKKKLEAFKVELRQSRTAVSSASLGRRCAGIGVGPCSREAPS